MTDKLSPLAQMRARLLEQDEKKNQARESYGSGIYPFWNAPENSTIVLRFLPNPENPIDDFWVEQLKIHIPFNGIKGEDKQMKLIIKVPCMEQWKKTDQILEAVKPFWKTSDEAIAKTYYKKRSYLYQGFVVSSPIVEEKPPENAIRRFQLNGDLHSKIKAEIMNTDRESLLVDYEGGYDFRVIRSKNPGAKWADYDKSNLSIKSRELTAEERAMIDKYGLFNLKSFLPKEPDAATQKLIFEMFEDSLAGEAFDAVKYKQFYKTGNNSSAETSDEEVAKPVETKTPAPIVVQKVEETSKNVTEEKAPVSDVLNKIRNKKTEEAKPIETKATQESSGEPTKSSASDVLAMLKNRQKKVN